MKISPMDIQRQAFGRKMRGLDAEEVRAYLNIVAEEVAALQMERDRLHHEVQEVRSLLDEHRQRETILKNTLLMAQRVSEEIKENARKQGETVIKEAEIQSDQLIGDRPLRRQCSGAPRSPRVTIASKQWPYGWSSPTCSRYQARECPRAQNSSTHRPASTSRPSFATT